jgi:hypothetical protein
MPIRISGSTGISGLDGSSGAPVYAGANSNVGLFISGNTVNVSANSISVGTTVISNSGVSVGGLGISQYSGMMKNRIINGDMRIDQRFNGAANTGVTGANQYVVDRWLCRTLISGRTRFQQNNTNGPGSSATQAATGFVSYFGANTVIANSSFGAGDQYWLLQCVEGNNIADLGWGTANAQPVTLSFWVYSSIAGTHAGSISNSNADRSYPFIYTISSANTWQHQNITIPGDTTGSWLSNNNIGMYVVYNLGSGSTYIASSGNSWQSGFYESVTGAVNPQGNANGSFYLTGVQLEEGSVATPFEFRHYTTELQLCQRYLAYFGNYDLEYIGTAFLYSTGTTGTSQTLFFPVRMRTKPTGLVTSGASNFAVSDGDSGSSLTALNLQSSNPSSMTFSFTVGASRTAFRPHTLYVSASGQYFYVSAELAVQN